MKIIDLPRPMRLTLGPKGWCVEVLNLNGHPAMSGTFATCEEATRKGIAYIRWVMSLEQQAVAS